MHNRACFWKPFGSERVNKDCYELKKKKKKTSGLIEIFMRESNYRVWITYFMFFM